MAARTAARFVLDSNPRGARRDDRAPMRVDRRHHRHSTSDPRSVDVPPGPRPGPQGGTSSSGPRRSLSGRKWAAGDSREAADRSAAGRWARDAARDAPPRDAPPRTLPRGAIRGWRSTTGTSGAGRSAAEGLPLAAVSGGSADGTGPRPTVADPRAGHGIRRAVDPWSPPWPEHVASGHAVPLSPTHGEWQR